MEIVDRAPEVHVSAAEYSRLLGFPRGHVMEGRVLELADWARAWYAAHGRPWIYARECGSLRIGDDAIDVDGVTFRSGRLRDTLDRAGAHGAVLVAVSAGPEIEDQARRAWLEEKPDEYFFLEMFGSAVVEQLTTLAGARLCAWADPRSLAILPHYSPGYPAWDIADQPALHALIGAGALPGALHVLESGMLRPKKSLLGVFGVTAHVDRVGRLADLIPCQQCSLGGCRFRRVPYARAAAGAPGAAAPAGPSEAYRLSPKALRRWAAERLSITDTGDGGVEALFRYDGMTCSNLGQSMTFLYRVRLGPRDQGYPIQTQQCAPAPGDDGHRAMCEYLRAGETLLEAIAGDQPLCGRPLDAVFSWPRPAAGPGCYCEPEARRHKWGLVLETIHYALRGSAGWPR